MTGFKRQPAPVLPALDEDAAQRFEAGSNPGPSGAANVAGTRRRPKGKQRSEALTAQLLIRLTPAERDAVEEAFRSSGYRYLNGFLRDLLNRSITPPREKAGTQG